MKILKAGKAMYGEFECSRCGCVFVQNLRNMKYYEPFDGATRLGYVECPNPGCGMAVSEYKPFSDLNAIDEKCAGLLFRAWHKENNRWYTVHHVVQSKGYPHFLIWDNGQWKYMSAKHFEPDEEDDYESITSN